MDRLYIRDPGRVVNRTLGFLVHVEPSRRGSFDIREIRVESSILVLLDSSYIFERLDVICDTRGES